MKKKYEISMNDDGNPTHYPQTTFNIEADTEFSAIQKAQKRYPSKKVCSVKQK